MPSSLECAGRPIAGVRGRRERRGRRSTRRTWPATRRAKARTRVPRRGLLVSTQSTHMCRQSSMKQSRWIVGRHVLYFGDLRQLRSGMHASDPPRHRTSMQTNKQTNDGCCTPATTRPVRSIRQRMTQAHTPDGLPAAGGDPNVSTPSIPSEYSEYPDGSTQNGIGRILELAVRPRLGRRRAKHADDAEALAEPKQLKQPEALLVLTPMVTATYSQPPALGALARPKRRREGARRALSCFRRPFALSGNCRLLASPVGSVRGRGTLWPAGANRALPLL